MCAATPRLWRKTCASTLVRAYADVKGLALEAAEQAVASLERDKRYLHGYVLMDGAARYFALPASRGEGKEAS